MLSILFKRLNSKRILSSLIFSVFILIILLFSNSIRIFQSSHNTSFNQTRRYPYLALIVDDRATPLLVNAVNNILQHIPVDWKVQIITLQQHWSFYKASSLGPLIKTNRIFLTPLEQSSKGLRSDDYINTVLTSASFWRQVRGDIVLFFQIDSVLCSNSLSNLTEFLEYDFIGAPWAVGGCCNGGLSVRNRTRILQMLESGQVTFRLHQINEDGWFTNNLPRFNGRIAPVPIAKKFSVETIYHPRPFGIHKPMISTLGQENMNRLCNECPELKSIGSYCQSITNISNSTKTVH